jgi:hypothetical protein
MSETFDAWNELYDAQTEALGIITATLTNIASNTPLVTNAPAVSAQVPLDQVLRAGGLSEAGQFELQMRASDFGNTPPPKLLTGVSVTGQGITSEAELTVLNCKVNGPIYYIAVGDMTALDG